MTVTNTFKNIRPLLMPFFLCAACLFGAVDPEVMDKANKGDPAAQNDVGLWYSEGLRGVPRSHTEAFAWFTKAATQGYAPAQKNLGVYYAAGRGVPQDYKKAVFWYTKAAEQGHPEAQHNLGVCYATGQGVPQDLKQAVFWYTRAAEQGFAPAQCNLGVFYATGQSVPQDFKQAVLWYAKAADQGYAPAQYNLATHYADGRGMPQDFKQAVLWYTKAAEQGLEEAQTSLGVCYGTGQGVAKDLNLGFFWTAKAADQGFPQAQHNLAGCYRTGQGVQADLRQAYRWYTKAAKNGLLAAQYDLGLCEYRGDGVEQSNISAHAWFNIAAANGDKNAAKNREIIENTMTPEQIEYAQDLALKLSDEIERAIAEYDTRRRVRSQERDTLFVTKRAEQSRQPKIEKQQQPKDELGVFSSDPRLVVSVTAGGAYVGAQRNANARPTTRTMTYGDELISQVGPVSNVTGIPNLLPGSGSAVYKAAHDALAKRYHALNQQVDGFVQGFGEKSSIEDYPDTVRPILMLLVDRRLELIREYDSLMQAVRESAASNARGSGTYRRPVPGAAGEFETYTVPGPHIESCAAQWRNRNGTAPNSFLDRVKYVKKQPTPGAVPDQNVTAASTAGRDQPPVSAERSAEEIQKSPAQRSSTVQKRSR